MAILLDGVRPDELPVGKELLSAVFTPAVTAGTEAEPPLAGTPASDLDLTLSKLSFRVPGLPEPVPLLFPREQGGGFVGSSAGALHESID